MSLWNTGAVSLWNSSAVSLWNSGAVSLWNTGAVSLWNTGAVSLWNTGAVSLWNSSAVSLWNTGAVSPWNTAAEANIPGWCTGGVWISTSRAGGECKVSPFSADPNSNFNDERFSVIAQLDWCILNPFSLTLSSDKRGMTE